MTYNYKEKKKRQNFINSQPSNTIFRWIERAKLIDAIFNSNNFIWYCTWTHSRCYNRWKTVFFRGVEIAAKRSLQPLYHIDFIWKLSEGARRLRQYNQFGRKIFEKVTMQTWFVLHKFRMNSIKKKSIFWSINQLMSIDDSEGSGERWLGHRYRTTLWCIEGESTIYDRKYFRWNSNHLDWRNVLTATIFYVYVLIIIMNSRRRTHHLRHRHLLH